MCVCVSQLVTLWGPHASPPQDRHPFIHPHAISRTHTHTHFLFSSLQGLVHRLDKDTSGVWLYAKVRSYVLMFLCVCHAKRRGALHFQPHAAHIQTYTRTQSKPVSARLSSQFKTRAVAKTYLAICHGDPCASSGSSSGGGIGKEGE